MKIKDKMNLENHKDEEDESAVSVSSTEKFRLKKKFGVLYGMAVIIGLTVGSGIFISPQIVLKNAGSPGLTLIIWVLGGVYALLGSLVMVEIGLQIPASGEKYAYLNELYNPYVGFLYMWQRLLLMRPGSNALKLIIFGRYILKPIFGYCAVPHLAIFTLATVAALSFGVLNSMKVKASARGQSFMTLINISTLVIIICFGIYHMSTESLVNFERPFKNSSTVPRNIVLAFYGAMFSYTGWGALNYISEEVINPTRTIPFAIILSSLLITILYTLVNFSYLVVLDTVEVMSSEATAIAMIGKISIAGSWLISILIGLSTCSSYNSSLLVGSRLAYVCARNGHLPRCISFINISNVSPIMAVILVTLVSLIYLWIFDATFLLNNLVFCFLAFECITSAGYVWRRVKLEKKNIKNKRNNFKIPLAIHIVFGAIMFIMALIPLFTNFMASAGLFFINVVTSALYYQIFVKKRLSNRWLNNVSDTANIFIQKLLYCVPEDVIR